MEIIIESIFSNIMFYKKDMLFIYVTIIINIQNEIHESKV